MGKPDLLSLAMVAAGLPDPVREFRFAPPRRWRFDYAFPTQRIALEVEGATWTGGRHTRGQGYENDCVKYSTAAIMGWKVIRATTGMVKDGRALSLLIQAFAKEGIGNDH